MDKARELSKLSRYAYLLGIDFGNGCSLDIFHWVEFSYNNSYRASIKATPFEHVTSHSLVHLFVGPGRGKFNSTGRQNAKRQLRRTYRDHGIQEVSTFQAKPVSQFSRFDGNSRRGPEFPHGTQRPILKEVSAYLH
ncbi:hypothetical protein Tco_0410244 [Tanacetum coccineum]